MPAKKVAEKDVELELKTGTEIFIESLRRLDFNVADPDENDEYIIATKSGYTVQVGFGELPSKFCINNGHIYHMKAWTTSYPENTLLDYSNGWVLFPPNSGSLRNIYMDIMEAEWYSRQSNSPPWGEYDVLISFARATNEDPTLPAEEPSSN